MRGVDLSLFDFDYDLTWMGFFLDPQLRVLGRYGGRDADGPEGRVSLTGLAYSMKRALEKHRAGKAGPVRKAVPVTVEDYPAAKKLPETSCVRCHQVNEVRRQSLQSAGKWSLDELWVYPLPENVGLSLEIDRGDMVAKVREGSPAEKAGLLKGDRLADVNGVSIASFADVQYALHRAPAKGKVIVSWVRDGKSMKSELVLTAGWKKTDISWRWSLRGLDPPPWVQGDDLTVEEKKKLGLSASRLALRQDGFVSQPARQAGIRQGDVIIGINGKALEMTGRQFGAYVRLTHKVGDRVTYNLLRDGKRIDVTLTLLGR
jgi:predicted metalloprotease with PDZ domain